MSSLAVERRTAAVERQAHRHEPADGDRAAAYELFHERLAQLFSLGDWHRLEHDSRRQDTCNQAVRRDFGTRSPTRDSTSCASTRSWREGSTSRSQASPANALYGGGSRWP
jgi:hypothetical protein